MDHRGDGEDSLSDESVPAEVGERTRPPAPLVHEVVRAEGEKELRRPVASLFWSGLAAGLGICASVQGEAFLHMHLPDATWRPAVESIGYTFGFLIVVLGRLQLFTENTITAILPLLRRRTSRMLRRTGRLWGVVLGANLLGTFLFALLSTKLGLSPDEHIAAFLSISTELLQKSPGEVLALAVPAGFLIAAVVWMLPSAEGSQAFVIFALTYLIAVGGFTHVIAGSTELFILVFEGRLAPFEATFAYFLPALVGNVLGGTGLFALLAYGQVSEEL
jgi:formate/nitrite transporter FocA (FNT family)